MLSSAEGMLEKMVFPNHGVRTAKRVGYLQLLTASRSYIILCTIFFQDASVFPESDVGGLKGHRAVN